MAWKRAWMQRTNSGPAELDTADPDDAIPPKPCLQANLGFESAFVRVIRTNELVVIPTYGGSGITRGRPESPQRLVPFGCTFRQKSSLDFEMAAAVP
jgi:hypothetical protein